MLRSCFTPLHHCIANTEFLETEREAAGFLRCCRHILSFLGGQRSRITTQTLQIIKPELDQAALATSPSPISALVQGESSYSPSCFGKWKRVVIGDFFRSIFDSSFQSYS